MPNTHTDPRDPAFAPGDDDALANGETLESVARFAADAGADPKYYERDLIDVLIAMQALVRNNPVTALIIAAGVGFLVGRTFSGAERKPPRRSLTE